VLPLTENSGASTWILLSHWLRSNQKLGCLAENCILIESSIERAIAGKAELVVFPELALTGYFLRDLVPDVALRLDAPEIMRLCELSRHVAIAAGFVEVSDDYRFFNSAIYIEGGEIRHIHRKVYLPTYGLFDEQRYLARASSSAPSIPDSGEWEYLSVRICGISRPPTSLPWTVPRLSSASPAALVEVSPRMRTWAQRLLGRNSPPRQQCSSTVVFSIAIALATKTGQLLGRIRGDSSLRKRCCQGTAVRRGSGLARIDEGELRRERIFSPMMRDENLSVTMKELRRIEKGRAC